MSIPPAVGHLTRVRHHCLCVCVCPGRALTFLSVTPGRNPLSQWHSSTLHCTDLLQKSLYTVIPTSAFLACPFHYKYEKNTSGAFHLCSQKEFCKREQHCPLAEGIFTFQKAQSTFRKYEYTQRQTHLSELPLKFL